MLGSDGKVTKQISAMVDYGQSLIKAIILPSKILVVDDAGYIKFLSHDGELRYK